VGLTLLPPSSIVILSGLDKKGDNWSNGVTAERGSPHREAAPVSSSIELCPKAAAATVRERSHNLKFQVKKKDLQRHFLEVQLQVGEFQGVQVPKRPQCWSGITMVLLHHTRAARLLLGFQGQKVGWLITQKAISFTISCTKFSHFEKIYFCEQREICQ
jgi:hypothetical protein